MDSERIVHVLTMPKRKRGTTPKCVHRERHIIRGDGFVLDNTAIKSTNAKYLTNSCVWGAISGHLAFGNELKETLWTAYGPMSDRYLDLETRKKYFYKQYKTAVEVYRKALA